MYLRSMLNMNQYKDYRYADTDRLNFADKKAQQEASVAQENREKSEEELKAKLEAGEISQAEYNTMSATTTQLAIDAFNSPVIAGIPQVDNTELLKQLSDEDYQYLNLK